MATYTERYIHAATRALPPQGRDDLARELDASIADAVAARTHGGEPADVAEREVLVGMGDPAKLAAEYADRPLMLVGPRYFLDWWRLLKLLLSIVPPIVAVVLALVEVLSGADIGEIIGSVVATTLTVGIHICFWVTLAFAILERTHPAARGPLLPWSLDQLPELRRPGVGLVDLVASLVFLVLAAGALFWDRFVGFIPTEPGLSILDPGLWPWGILYVLAVIVAEGALAAAVHRIGRWTAALAVVNTVLAVAIAIPAVWLVAGGMLVNPAFVDLVVPGVEIAPVAGAVIVLSVAAVALWDVVDGWYKTYRDRRA